MKILFFTHNFNFEGAPNVLFHLAKAIHEKNKDNVVILSLKDGPARSQLTRAGILTLLVPEAPKTFHEILLAEQILYQQYSSKLMNQFLELSPDVVIVNVLHSFFIVNLLHSSGIPSIWIIHESYEIKNYLSLLPEYHHNEVRKAFQQAGKIVFASHALPSLYRDCLCLDNWQVIHPAIPALFSVDRGKMPLREQGRNLLKLRKDDTMILSVGAMEPHKNQVLIVEAANHLRQQEIRIFLVGGNPESPYQQVLDEKISTYGLQEKLTIVPQVEDVVPFYLAADIFVFTSTWDTYPLVVMEAMAFGLPVVATSTTGVKEQVRFGFNALETSGDPRELAKYIEKLVMEPGLRADMGRHSRMVYEEVPSHQEMVKCYEQLIRQISR